MISMNSLQNSTLKHLFKLPLIAAKSHVNHKHAAVIIINGKPVSYGFNSIRGGRTEHAECAALRSYLISRGFLGWFKEQRILRRRAKLKT